MCKERVVFFIAGTLVGVGTLLAWLVSPWWLLLSGFVGVNMFQSSLTGFCLMSKFLNLMKVKHCTVMSPLS